ncbi:DUF2693 domain-containing protein [bacterium]|nr:DUF2693 domain-containing protein [bacterium]
MNVFSKEYEDHEMARDWLIGHLRYGPVTVKFKKSNGEEREMNCTLKEGIVVPYQPKTEKTKKQNPDILPVWDIDKNEWRSFRYDSIIHVTFGIEEGVQNG